MNFKNAISKLFMKKALHFAVYDAMCLSYSIS